MLSPSTSHKYLGVTRSSGSTLTNHIHHISKNATSILGFIKPDLKLPPPFVKRIACTSLVRPKLEYAAFIWDRSQTNLRNVLESVQNGEAGFILPDYGFSSSIRNMKTSLGLVFLTYSYVADFSSLTFPIFFFNRSIRMAHITNAHHVYDRPDHPLKAKRNQCRSNYFSETYFF